MTQALGLCPHIERTFTASDGVELFLRDYPGPETGDRHAPTVLCLPGLTRNSKDFHGLACWLQPRFRVICPDYRGRGRSGYDPKPMNYKAETYLEDIRHMLCVLGIHDIFVIGTSLGGILAMGLAVTMPGGLKGALLNDIGPEVSLPSLRDIFKYMKQKGDHPDWESAKTALRTAFPHLPAYNEEDWQEITECTFVEDQKTGRVRRDWDPNVIRPLLNPVAEKVDLWPLFKALSPHPVAVLRGELSDILTPETVDKMRAMKPDLVTETLPGVGHAPGLKEKKSREVIDALLRQL